MRFFAFVFIFFCPGWEGKNGLRVPVGFFWILWSWRALTFELLAQNFWSCPDQLLDAHQDQICVFVWFFSFCCSPSSIGSHYSHSQCSCFQNPSQTLQGQRNG